MTGSPPCSSTCPPHTGRSSTRCPISPARPPEPYLPKWAVADDPAWDHFTGFLAPDAYALQTIWNRRLLAIFADKGDVLAATREVDHMVYFPSRARAEAAVAVLRAHGFATDEIDAPKDDAGGWGLQFHRDDALADGRPDEFVAEIFELIGPLDGRYDGWGATHITAS